MKKLLAVLLVLSMMLTGAALAEEESAVSAEPDSGFGGVWICDRAVADINWEEEGYRVFIRWSSSASEFSEWEYSCLYHAEDNTLVSMPFGIRADLTVADDQTATASVIYEDGEAEFSLTEDGKLVWKDLKEDAGAEMLFEKDTQFEGLWECDRATMLIVEEDDGYRVHIEWGSSAWELTEWNYACFLKSNGFLISTPFGQREDVVYNDGGEEESRETIYDDDTGYFSKTTDGRVIWVSEKETFDQEMIFEWVSTVEEYLEKSAEADG